VKTNPGMRTLKPTQELSLKYAQSHLWDAHQNRTDQNWGHCYSICYTNLQSRQDNKPTFQYLSQYYPHIFWSSNMIPNQKKELVF
jgi:hypothetical protein